MKIEDLKPREKKDKLISVRIKKSDFIWLKEKEISPTMLFESALNDIKRIIKENEF